MKTTHAMTRIARLRKHPAAERPLSNKTLAAIEEILIADYIIDLQEGIDGHTALTHLFRIPCVHSHRGTAGDSKATA